MIKSQLICRIADMNPHLSEGDVERVLNAILGRITQALADGDRVELRGFGNFFVKDRNARQGRNPKTGERVAVDAKAAAVFRQSKAMLEQLNGWPAGSLGRSSVSSDADAEGRA